MGYRDSLAITLTLIPCVEDPVERFLRFGLQDLWILTPLVTKHLTFYSIFGILKYTSYMLKIMAILLCNIREPNPNTTCPLVWIR